jgi:hypothetical protein
MSSDNAKKRSNEYPFVGAGSTRSSLVGIVPSMVESGRNRHRDGRHKMQHASEAAQRRGLELAPQRFVKR